MTASNYENLLIEHAHPGIAILKINRPKALNALNSATLLELRRALLSLAQDDAVRVIVFTGEGEKAFIAGADISEMKDLTPGDGVGFSQVGHEVAKLLETMPKPVIAAVNGFALGGGTEMAIACDFIIASEKAIFGQPEVGLGIIPGFGGCFRLARAVGLPRAKELIYSGRKVKADEAKAMGLVNHVLPAEGFMEAVLVHAKSIALQSASAVSKAKTLMVEFTEAMGLNTKVDAESHAFGRLMGSFDQREGMTAFTEKRKPEFHGLREADLKSN
ncbi:MAG: enoyl-CoA hydratase/isomerase family protein [Cryobacterium sp.]|nr:enoyl-CoA hydratase/isomerase family protein [Oligoflexia bacterium]